MAIRNFWLEASVDGYKTTLRGGPRNKEGGMNVCVYQRSDGQIEESIRVSCFEVGGMLHSKVYLNGEKVGEYVSKR